MCKAGCARKIREIDIHMTPELASGYCNWCRPEQIPKHKRLYLPSGTWLRDREFNDKGDRLP